MSAELLPVWHEIEKYLEWGISVIPVRDKDDAYGVAKSPFGKSWREYQDKIILKDVLFQLMDERYNTTAIGIIGGRVSGNFEIIDIDVKYKPGIDATLFTDLKTLYPDLLKKLRIHQSPSGGYHILYRCESEVEGNQKLAGREKTADELIKEPKPRIVNFLESRGEGGYVVAPPALGYKVVKDHPIPVLTVAERNSIISLCRSYNEIIKPATSLYKSNVRDVQYYDCSPFDDFDQRCDPSKLMSELGWTEFKANNHFVWYTRPGKSKGVSMSFNLQTRFFFCFTASTELEENKGYSPCNLLATVKFNNDKKRLYADLVFRGYGKIKPKVEAKIAKTAALNGEPLPANISNTASSMHAEISAVMNEQYPYGVFWVDDPEKGILIDREKLYRVSDGLGFRLWNTKLVRTDEKFIDECEDRYYYDTLKAYVQEEDADLYRDICNSFEVFIEKHGRFTITRLTILPDSFILKDTKDSAYKCYLNGVLRITATSIDLLEIVPLLIWRKNVQNRRFNFGDSGRYIEFLKLATDFEANREYILSCIGFLAHEYKDETAGYIIVITEQCENPKDGGGAGKNVFSNLFKFITSFTGKPGEQIKYDEKFLQSWNYQKIFCISDAPKNFNFSFLKELSTGTGLMKKLFKDESEIPSDLMPKFLVQTNFSIEIKDGGLKRRVKIVEFTDFFTNAGGIDVHFGKHFPNEWNDQDWNGFDTVMANSIQTWMRGNRKIKESLLSASGWAKQFEQTFGESVYRFILENFEKWVGLIWVSNTLFDASLTNFYKENKTPEKYQVSSMKLNNAIREFCKYKSIEYSTNLPHRSQVGITEKHRKFGYDDNVPF